MFQKRIQDAYDTLSPRFKRLGTYILENTIDVGFLTATELAQHVSVDPATVVRFAQELGYTGYRELSKEIKQYVNEQITLRSRSGSLEQGSLPAQASEFIDHLSERILDLKINADRLVTIATLISDAHHIYVTGTSESWGLASMWVLYLQLIGLPVTCFQMDAVHTAFLMRDMVEGDVVIAVTLGLDPGAEITRLIENANKSGIKTITISGSSSIKLARKASLNVETNAQTPLHYPSFDTTAAALSILWQLIILLKREKMTEDVNQTIFCMDTIFQSTYKKSQYDAAALKRLWEP